MHGQGRHPPWIEELHCQRGDENGKPGPISLLDALGRLELPTSRLSDISRGLVSAGIRGISPILRSWALASDDTDCVTARAARSACSFALPRRILSAMSDPVTRLNAALEGRYAIERELGEGGMATVYLADDVKHERKRGWVGGPRCRRHRGLRGPGDVRRRSTASGENHAEQWRYRGLSDRTDRFHAR